MSFIKEAFEKTCLESKKAEGYYVVLMEKTSYYGGPEEGGWWGHDHIIVAYQYYPVLEQAEAAKEAVLKLAEELNEQEKKAFGDHCLRTMEWLEAHGLDADYLHEPDGESQYYVLVSEGLPEETRGPRHYE